MTDPLDPVRARMADPEDVDMGEVPVAGDAPGEEYDQHGDPGPDFREEAPPAPPGEDELPPEARCAGLPLNDYGNGQRFVIHFGEDLLFVPRVGWFVWTGQVWSKDPDTISVRRKAQQIAALIKAEIRHLTHAPEDQALIDRAADLTAQEAEIDAVPVKDRTPDQAQRYAEVTAKLRRIRDLRDRLDKAKSQMRSHARGSGNSPKIKALIGESETAIARALEELDADPLMVNCQSGALLARGPTKDSIARVDLIPHSRDQLLTKMMPVDWVPDAPRPLFDAFMMRIQPDPQMRFFIQRWFGLSMTGLTGEQKLTFFYGGGANGKSVLVDLMARMMGDYAATAKIESLTGRNRRSGGDATPDLVPLIGARLVRASEPEEGERLQEGKIKELTGGEPILVRALNEDFIEALPKFKLTISGNHKPEIRGNDDGIWRRVLLVPFGVQIPKDERDPLLGEKLWAERDGILQWMVEGLIDYLQGGLREPEAVLSATAEYREESDPLGNFLTDCCIVTGDPADTVRTAELTNAFNYWLIERGVTQWKGTTIQRQLAGMAKHWRHPKTGLTIAKGKSSLSQYEGLRFTDIFKDRFDRAPKDAAGRALAAASDEPPHGASYEDF